MLIAWLPAWTALAGAPTARDLAAEAGSEPVFAVECQHARQISTLPGADSIGNPFGEIGLVGEVFDGEAPLAAIVHGGDPPVLRLDAGVRSPLLVAAALAFVPDVDARLTGHRLRVVMAVPDLEIPAVPEARVAGAVTDAFDGDGCMLGFDWATMAAITGTFGDVEFPFPVRLGLIQVRDAPKGALDVQLETSLPRDLAAALAPLDVELPDVRLSRPYPIVFQSALPIVELVRVATGLMPASALDPALLDKADRRVRGRPGVTVAVGPGLPGVVAIPFQKPRSAKRLARMAGLVSERLGLPYERVGRARGRVLLKNGVRAAVGARRGLLVLSEDPTLVEEFLDNRGPSVLPAPSGPLALRGSMAGLGLPGLPSGAFEASFVDDRLLLRFRPLE